MWACSFAFSFSARRGSFGNRSLLACELLNHHHELLHVQTVPPRLEQRTFSDGAREVAPLFAVALTPGRDERPLPAPRVDHALALELVVGLRDGARIDDELSRELANGRQRLFGPKGPDHDSSPHLVHDLEVERTPVVGIEIHQHRHPAAVLYTCATLHQTPVGVQPANNIRDTPTVP